MSTRTLAMTHFQCAANGFIELEAKASGLADEMFFGVQTLEAELNEGESLLTVAGMQLSEVEHECSKKLAIETNDHTMTLSKYSSSWKVRKSELLSAIKAGVCFNDAESFSGMRKLKDNLKGTNSSGTNTGNEKKAGTDNAKTAPPSKTAPSHSPSSNKTEPNGGLAKTTELHAVTSPLSDKVQDQLNKLIVHMTSLTEEGQLKYLEDSDRALTRLTKAGGRFLNVG
jgi:hypothetical protein